MTFSDGVWYLRGNSGDKPFLWWFRLDRIKYIKLEEEIFSIPEDFKKEAYLYSENVERSGREGVEPQRCKIKMSRHIYETVRDDVLFKNSSCTPEGDEYVVEIFTDRFEAIFEFLFRNADHAQLIGPEFLKQKFLLKLKSLLDSLLLSKTKKL